VAEQALELRLLNKSRIADGGRKFRTFRAVQAARRQYLKTSDIVEATIANASGTIDLGVQRNVVVEEGL